MFFAADIILKPASSAILSTHRFRLYASLPPERSELDAQQESREPVARIHMQSTFTLLLHQVFRPLYNADYRLICSRVTGKLSKCPSCLRVPS